MAEALRGAAASRWLRSQSLARLLDRVLLSPCCEQAGESQTLHERGDDSGFLAQMIY